MPDPVGIPVFSVIICTYNRASVLPRAIASVLDQTFGDFEVVVVDDGSNDDTRAVVTSYTDPRVRLVSQANQGLGAARNAGAAAASGRYVTFLDDDDLAFPAWLERFAAAIGSDTAVVSCGELVCDDDGELLETRLPGPLGPGFAGYEGWFLPGTFIVRRDVYLAAGGFRAGLPHLHQTEFVLRLLPLCRERGWEVSAIGEPLVQRHAGGDRRIGLENTRAMYEAMDYIVAEHHDQLAKSSWLLAQYSAVAGVAAARIGDYRSARRHLRRAVRTRPRAGKHWARLALATFPPAGRAVWGRTHAGELTRGAE
ncbi:MAG: glycosyltransferase family 2 protein [Acidimicrobiia bacterium]